MRPLVLLAVSILLLPLAPAREASAPDVPGWLASELEARGVPREDWDQLVVERRILEEGAWRVEAATLADLAQAPQAAAGVEAPHAVLGNLFHIMIQFGRCDGYATEALAGGLTKVGGTWETGFHVTSFQQGAPGVDTGDAQGSLTSQTAHSDFSVAGLGEVSIVEDRIVFFGTCFALVGTMTGAGAFAFDQTWPA